MTLGGIELENQFTSRQHRKALHGTMLRWELLPHVNTTFQLLLYRDVKQQL